MPRGTPKTESERRVGWPRPELNPIQAPTTVTITLSILDAEDIRATCNIIGGMPSGPRGAFYRLNAELASRGVRLHDGLVRAWGDVPIFISYNTHKGGF